MPPKWQHTSRLSLADRPARLAAMSHKPASRDGGFARQGRAQLLIAATCCSQPAGCADPDSLLEGIGLVTRYLLGASGAQQEQGLSGTELARLVSAARTAAVVAAYRGWPALTRLMLPAVALNCRWESERNDHVGCSGGLMEQSTVWCVHNVGRVGTCTVHQLSAAGMMWAGLPFALRVGGEGYHAAMNTTVLPVWHFCPCTAP
jgi:hypothetical protein